MNLEALDAGLLRAPASLRRTILVLTVIGMVAVSVPKVPRSFVDYQQVPLLDAIDQPATFGTDTIADGYEARVVLNDVRDMYAKRLVAQTPIEAQTWSKEASAPYPPVVLLVEAALAGVGAWIGIGLYGMVLVVAATFVALSLYYSVKTRWYLFPLLYLNFSYFSERFVTVQDGTYLIMLAVLMVAMLLARAGSAWCHGAVAVAITMKLSPLYYVKNLFAMPRRSAAGVLLILIVGLALPILVWDNYLYILRFSELKGHAYSTLLAGVLATIFAVVLAYIEMRLGFDWEDRIGWGLVPFALFLAFKMNVARHLLIVLLVPDKRVMRTLAVALALAGPALLPHRLRLNDALPIATIVLAATLVIYLRRIGWGTVRQDVRRPLHLLREMLLHP